MRDARHGHARNAFCLLTRCERVSPSQTPRWNRGLGAGGGAAGGAEILRIACYGVASAVRKSVTMVARQTSAVLDRQSEHIADAAFGLNDPRRT